MVSAVYAIPLSRCLDGSSAEAEVHPYSLLARSVGGIWVDWCVLIVEPTLVLTVIAPGMAAVAHGFAPLRERCIT